MSTERKPLLKKKPSGKFKMADFQRTDLARLDELDNSANWSEMGCVSGSTLIQFNRAGKGFQMRVDKAYRAFHGLNNHPNSNWNPNIETRVQSFIDDRIRLSRMFNIVDSGDKQTIQITTESGLKLRLTPEHLVLTEEGWVEAKDTLGHSVVRRGDKSGKSINYVDLETNPRSLGNGRFIDKDGYVRILAYGHPRANRSNHVYEHILVMEEELGEYISEGFHVHHIDGNRSNNAYENLELKTVFEHLSDHARVRGFGTYGAKFDPVVLIEDGPVEPVYDLIMNEDYPNFVASGIVVHNSFKTTTAEWLMARKLRNIPNPRVLVVTTKSGKGTYFESLPEVLPEWDVFAVTNQRVMPVIGSRPVPISVELPNPLYMRPVIAVAHYHCFTNRACVPQEIKEVKIINGNEVKVPILDQETGLFKMTTPKLGFLLHNHWDMVILDEAHRIKNQDSQWTHNIKKISATYKHVMTGTGFINNPAEVWSLLNFLFPKTYTSYWKFRERFCEEEEYNGYRKVVGIKWETEEEFRELVRRVGVRRSMLECFPNIKEPIKSTIPVDLNPVQKKMYVEILKDLNTMDAMGVPLFSPNVLSMLNRLRQICVATPEVVEDRYDAKLDRRIIRVKLTEPSSKLDALMELIDGLEWSIEDKQQLVVFSNFKDPLELLKKRLDKAKIPYLHMSANDNEKVRYEKWHDIWPKKEHQIFLCTLAVGSESINLTSAHRAVFLDQSWSPKDNNQAIGRIYRPGQTGATQLIYIRAEGTVDDRILHANEEKTGWFNSIFGNMPDKEENGENEDD